MGLEKESARSYYYRRKIAIIAKFSRGFHTKPQADDIRIMEARAKEALRQKLSTFPELQVIEIVWGD